MEYIFLIHLFWRQQLKEGSYCSEHWVVSRGKGGSASVRQKRGLCFVARGHSSQGCDTVELFWVIKNRVHSHEDIQREVLQHFRYISISMRKLMCLCCNNDEHCKIWVCLSHWFLQAWCLTHSRDTATAFLSNHESSLTRHNKLML